MKLSKRQLKRIIREEYSRLKRRGLIREYGAPGIGGQGNDTLGSEISHPEGPSIGNRGLGWADFQALAQDGDYAAAGEWLKQYCQDRGYLCNRDIENHLIGIAQDEYISGSELQDELVALLDHFANDTLREGAYEKLNSDVTGDSSNLDQEVYFGLEEDIVELIAKYADNIRYAQHGVTAEDVFEELKLVISELDLSTHPTLRM